MTALFANFDFFKQNVESAKSSLGALNEQNEIYLDSIDAKLDQLSATTDSIKFDLFMGTDWGNAIDALNTILKGVRGLVDDFGGLSGILVTTGALLTKTFAPKLITDFATKFAKMRNDWKELEKKPFINLGTANENYFSSTKSTVQFFTNALEKGTTEAKDNIRIMNSILQSGGKEALQTYEQISEQIQNAIKQKNSYVSSALEQASRNNNNNVNLFESGNLFNSSENLLGTDIDVSSIVSISGTLDDAMKSLGLSSKDTMAIMNQFGSMIEQNLPTNEAFNQIIKHNIIVTDRDKVIAAAGPLKKKYIDKEINDFTERSIERRDNFFEKQKREFQIINDESEVGYYTFSSIVDNGDAIGSVVLISTDTPITDIEDNMCINLSKLLSKQYSN